MKSLLFASLSALILLSTPAKADEPMDGKTIFRTRTCMACHGPKGAKPIQSYPALAGQNEKYVALQIFDIKAGKRVGSNDETGHPRTQGMADILHILTDADIKAVSKYVSEQEPGKPKPLDPPPAAEDIGKGQAAFKKLGCVTCHGADGKKTNNPAYPILAGLHRDYLVRQMTELRGGQRANGQSKVMVNFIKKADDATILQIASYLSQVERAPK